MNNTHQQIEWLNKFYLDYFNNYLTVEKMAEHHGISAEECRILVAAGKEVHALKWEPKPYN